MLIKMTHPAAGTFRMVGSPYHLERTPVETYEAPPELGADTAEVLKETLGWSPEAIEAGVQSGGISLGSPTD